MPVPDTDPTPDFDNLGRDTSFQNITPRRLILALRLAGVDISEQQQEDAIAQLCWWDDHPFDS